MNITEILESHTKWLNDEDGGIRADLSGADLRGADLRGAGLSGADLSGADLSGADLRDANLRLADLSGADLRDANLRLANLSGADLRLADLRLADLSRADLRDANLRRANLSGADLSGADLRDANLRLANLSGADLRLADIDLCIEDGLIEKIAGIVVENDKALAMGTWHTCDTTHCIAGWACHLAKGGKELEEKHGAEVAGLMLLGPEAHSHFFDDNETATRWLKTKIEKK